MEYSDAPVFIVHGDGNMESGTFKAIDGSGKTCTIKSNSDGSVEINGTKYYSASQVDQLISNLNTTLRSWATGQFEPKA